MGPSNRTKDNKIIFTVLFVLVVSIAGCTGQQDVTSIVKNIPQVKEFLSDYPNADFKVVFLDKDYVESNIDAIKRECGEQMRIQDYYKAMISAERTNLTLYLDGDNQKVLCVFGRDITTTTTITSTTITSSTTTTSDTTTSTSTTTTTMFDTTTTSTNTTMTTLTDCLLECQQQYRQCQESCQGQRQQASKQVNASHILVNSTKLAEKVLQELKSRSFEEVAEEYSAGPSASRGGNLGFFSRGQMVKNFSDAAFALDIKEISNIVKTQYGYHIIKVHDKKMIDYSTTAPSSAGGGGGGAAVTTVTTSTTTTTLTNCLLNCRQEYQQCQQSCRQQNQSDTEQVPKVELFVMSYCPFGTQAEKGMILVATLLGDKIDFNIRFVDYAMHDKKEIDENLRQYCVQEKQNDKFIDYLTCFLEDGKYEACLNEADIDTQGLDACMARVDEEFNITGKFNDKSTWSGGRFPPFDVHADLNDKYGVRGSPTLVINGKQVQSGRAPANYLNNICSAFTTQPEECNEQLSSKTPSRGFGISETGSGGSGGSCG